MKKSEKWYPLKLFVCDHCWLVQTEDFVGVNEMFSEDYAMSTGFHVNFGKFGNSNCICCMHSEYSVNFTELCEF